MTQMPIRLLDLLRTLNAKERFFLLGHALGNPQFTLTEQFRFKLGELLSVRIPEDAFCGMDYHLDWLYAALQLSANGDTVGIYPNDDGIIKAHQEDIDLLVGFKDGDGCRIILIEAKAATVWKSGQMKSKANRMADIFGSDGYKWEGVTAHFVLTSPNQPQRLTVADWPQWMAPNNEYLWMQLDFSADLKRVSRCTSDGTPNAQGRYWTVVDR